MIISANGIVFNGYGEVLLVQRDDTRTLAPPGGACEIDELPPDAAAREVREETGLIVFPVRLVGLYFLPTQPHEFLFLCFRCIQRGGEISTSNETPKAGFFEPKTVTGPMLALHREQIEEAYLHSGGPPIWSSHPLSAKLRLGNLVLNRIIYPLLRLRRARLGQPEYVPPPDWQVRSVVILASIDGRILLQQVSASDAWSLPTSAASTTSPPWVLAENLLQREVGIEASLVGLAGIYVQKGEPEMLFAFLTGPQEHASETGPEHAWFHSDELPQSLLPEHRAILQNAWESGEQISHGILGND